jgi:hypothetical protein
MTYTNFDVKCAVAHGEDLMGKGEPLEYNDFHVAVLCCEYKKSRRLSAIVGKIIGLVVLAAIFVLSSAVLIYALKLLGRAIGV